METRPWEKTTLSENNTQKKETYEKKHLDIFLVQRSPDQKMKMGRLGERMTEYQLPYRNVLPVPIFMPSKVMTTLSENNTQKKETYEKKHLDIFLVQRSPDQKMKMGRLGERMTEYQLPYRNVLPVPIFMPSKVMSVAKDLTRAPTPAELKAIMEFEKALSKGVSVGRREISEITKEMPKVIQPIRMDFRASNLVAPRNVLPQFEAVLRS
ncbi:TELT protein, partial [Polyodon spathula]|nr:TELT protein [Polyodon spathula]